MDFRKEVPDLQTRKQESQNLCQNHPNKAPVIIQPSNIPQNTLRIPQNKFLVPMLYTFHEFLFHLRKKLQMSSNESLYIVVGNAHMPAMNKTIKQIYSELKDPDGFLYITYSSEAVLG